MVQNCNKIINKIIFWTKQLIYDFIIAPSFQAVFFLNLMQASPLYHKLNSFQYPLINYLGIVNSDSFRTKTISDISIEVGSKTISDVIKDFANWHLATNEKMQVQVHGKGAPCQNDFFIADLNIVIYSSNFCLLLISIQVLFTSDNLFRLDEKKIYF